MSFCLDMGEPMISTRVVDSEPHGASLRTSTRKQGHLSQQGRVARVPHPLPTGKGWGKDSPCNDRDTCGTFRDLLRPPPFGSTQRMGHPPHGAACGQAHVNKVT